MLTYMVHILFMAISSLCYYKFLPNRACRSASVKVLTGAQILTAVICHKYATITSAAGVAIKLDITDTRYLIGFSSVSPFFNILFHRFLDQVYRQNRGSI